MDSQNLYMQDFVFEIFERLPQSKINKLIELFPIPDKFPGDRDKYLRACETYQQKAERYGMDEEEPMKFFLFYMAVMENSH